MKQQHLPENNTDTGWLLSAGSSASIADDDDLDGMNNLSSTSFLRRAQPMSIVISLILSPVAIAVVSIWASVLGGVSWSEGDAKHMFNWHPVMMVIAYAIMNVGTLAFRASGTSAYQTTLFVVVIIIEECFIFISSFCHLTGSKESTGCKVFSCVNVDAQRSLWYCRRTCCFQIT
jgi:hypothetical protein